MSDAREKLKQQEEMIAKLRQENVVLHEMVKRKDAIIESMVRDSREPQRFNKTEATSRESDDHLRAREVTILRRKNRRLQKALRAKQQTVSELLQLVGHVTAQQGAESSAFEEDVDEDDGCSAEEAMFLAGLAKGKAATAAQALAETRAEAEDSDASDTEPSPTSAKQRATGRDGAPWQGGACPAKLSGGSKFQPPPRVAGQGGAAAAAAVAQPRQQKATPSPQQASPAPSSRASPAHAVQRQAPAPQRPAGGRPAVNAPDLDFAPVGGLPPGGFGSSGGNAQDGMSEGSRTALEALARELALLEEKKRAVEQLARKLEPESDGEEVDEDDGFPLR